MPSTEVFLAAWCVVGGGFALLVGRALDRAEQRDEQRRRELRDDLDRVCPPRVLPGPDENRWAS